MIQKFDKLVLGLLCCAIAAVVGYISVVSLAHWAMTGDMLFFEAFDPDRISVRGRRIDGDSPWSERSATPGSYDFYSSLLAYLCMAAMAPLLGWIGLVKGFGVRAAESLLPFVRVCAMAGGVLFAALVLLRIADSLVG